MSKLDYFKPFGFLKLTSDFGWRPNPFGEGGKEWHQGIDLVKADKSTIPSFTDGEVVFAQEGYKGSGFGGYGNAVAVKDKNNCLHVYAHLDSISVKVKDKVKKGQEVGKQGTTGRSTGSHLHYEIRKKSTPSFGFSTDKENYCHEPYAYLTKFFGGSEIEMKAETANEIIKYLSAAYKQAEKAEQDKIHKLANELRKISGQEVK